MHFILHIHVWLYQGFHAIVHCCTALACGAGYPNPNQPDDAASVSGVDARIPPPNIPNPDTSRLGVHTRQQTAAIDMANAATTSAPAAPTASQGEQSVTATIDYYALTTAMSRLNDDSASNLEKGTQLKWDFLGTGLSLTSRIKSRYGQIRMTYGTCLSIYRRLLYCVSMK